MKPPQPTPYRILTARTLIRCWDPADAPARRAGLDANDAHLRPWIPWMSEEPQPLDATLAWIRQARARFDSDEDHRYGIFDRAGERMLGETGLYTRVGPGAREIGYWIDHREAGRGLAREAAAAMVKVAFELFGVDRVEMHCSPANAASARIPERLGFTHEATLRRRSTRSDGTVDDSMIWTLFAEAYPGSPSASAEIAAYDALDRPLL